MRHVRLDRKHFYFSFTLMRAFATIAVIPPVEIPDEKMEWISLGILSRIPGTSSTLIPIAKLMAITSTALRLMSVAAMIRIPDAATVPNMRSVAPPRTQSGMREKNCPTTGKSPRRNNAPAMKYPT